MQRFVLGKAHDGYAVFDTETRCYAGVRMTLTDALSLWADLLSEGE